MLIRKWSLKTLSSGLALGMVLSACSTARQVRQGNPSQPPLLEELGPPEPQRIYGPEAAERSRVVVVIGPGVAGAVAGAGVIRAIEDIGLRISAVAGTGFGSFVAAAYARDGSANKMDWLLVRFKPQWLHRSDGFAGWVSGGRRSSEGLLTGLRKVFDGARVEQAKVPLWIFGSKTAGRITVRTEGLLAGEICHQVAQDEGMETCSGDAGPTRAEGDPSELRAALESSGFLDPIIWVVPPGKSAEKEEFSRMVDTESLPGDLKVVPSIEGLDHSLLSRRSEIVYAGRREAAARLKQWLSSEGGNP